ncbi:hypothetical protein LP419_00985 [Massilia sp. H-1]|nr:hypothetical protein LP419_00985 [Massilia sp. H-1]
MIGYQRSILLGAVFMAVGLFMISFPDKDIFKLGLATIIVGNGMFKPNISTMVGKLYALNDTRHDSGFTIFYMGINLGAFMAPILTQYLAQKIFNTGDTPAYKIVFFAAGIGMLISLVWFYFGRATLKGIGAPEGEAKDPKRVIMVAVGALFVIPVMYLLLKAGAFNLQIVLMVLFAALAAMLMIEGIKDGTIARDKTIAMMIIFAFNILFWAFFEQAGSSFTFLAENIVNRVGALGMDVFPDRLLPECELGRRDCLRTGDRLGMGRHGQKERESIDSTQIRPGHSVQRRRLRPAVVRTDLPGRHAKPESTVLDPVRRVLDPVDRRAVPVPNRPVDGHQTGTGTPGWPGHGRLVPVDRYRQQPVGHLCQRRQRRNGHVGGFGADRLHQRFLDSDHWRRDPVPAGPVHPEVDARR